MAVILKEVVVNLSEVLRSFFFYAYVHRISQNTFNCITTVS